jgi:cytochrome c biogenesis protein CcmG/thiol:disulfide interchange protein DsbE
MRKAALAACVLFVVAALPAAGEGERIILRDLDGNRVYVDSLLADGPVVLNFWATWCRPCRVEMPKLQAVGVELAGKNVHFAAVSLDARQNKGKVDAYIEQNAVSIPVYRDPEGTLAKRFKVVAIPTTFLLDQTGEIVYSTRGYRPGDEILLKKEIEALIAKRDKKAEGEASPQ